MTRLAMLLGLGVFMISAPTGAADEDLAGLETALSLWQAAQDGNYRFRYQKYCDCDRNEPKITVVTVANGEISGVHHLFSDSDREVPAREGSLSEYWTMDDLFQKLAAAYARNATVRVQFDDRYGNPSSIYIDYLPDMVGEETDLRGIGFEPL